MSTFTNHCCYIKLVKKKKPTGTGVKEGEICHAQRLSNSFRNVLALVILTILILMAMVMPLMTSALTILPLTVVKMMNLPLNPPKSPLLALITQDLMLHMVQTVSNSSNTFLLCLILRLYVCVTMKEPTAHSRVPNFLQWLSSSMTLTLHLMLVTRSLTEMQPPRCQVRLG